jgi:hypothetical protein
VALPAVPTAKRDRSPATTSCGRNSSWLEPISAPGSRRSRCAPPRWPRSDAGAAAPASSAWRGCGRCGTGAA